MLFPHDHIPHCNKISPQASQRPQPWQQALELFDAMAQQADVAVAHNAAFDRSWFGHPPLPPLSLPWICTCTAPWPSELGLRKEKVSLENLARALGLVILDEETLLQHLQPSTTG